MERVRCTHIFGAIVLAAKTSPASLLITQQLISKSSLLLTITSLLFASPSFVGAMDGDEDACGTGPGRASAALLEQRCSGGRIEAVTVSKGVKERGIGTGIGHRVPLECPRLFCPIQGKCSIKNFCLTSEHDIPIPVFTLQQRNPPEMHRMT